jgi:hypothetical protein
MPGEFIEEVHIYQCGTHADGTAIYCSEIGYAKIPFESFESEDPSSVGWRQADYTDIHIPLTRLVAAMKQFGVTVSYDEEEWPAGSDHHPTRMTPSLST